MSQFLSQKEDPVYISISIAKFSHNTCPLGTRNFTWTHVGLRNDLDFTVRRTRVVDEHGNFNERLVMKVTAGAELLENQDLGQLVQHCHMFDSSTGAEHPVQMVVKCPFMALRYPKNASNVRRVQVKFHNESDFTKALGIMQELGLPITDSVPPVPPPVPTPSPAPSTSTISAETAVSSSRPASANPYAVNNQFLDTSSLAASKSEFKIPIRPDLAGPRPRSALSYSNSSISSIPRSISTSSASSTFNHTPPPLYVSQIEKESQSQPLSLSNISQKPDEKHLIFPFKLKLPQETTLSSNVESASGVVSPFFADRRPEICHVEPSQSSQSAASTSVSLHHRRLWQSDLERPSSTPIQSNYNNSTPSNNSLAFPSKTQTKARATSVSILPPLPKPTPVSKTQSAIKSPEISAENTPTPTHKPAKKRVAQRKSTNVLPPNESASAEVTQPEPLVKETVAKQSIIFEQPAEPEEEPSPLAAKSAAVAPRPASAIAGLQSKAVTTKKRPATPIRPPSAAKRPKMVDQATQTQTLSGRDHTTARRATPTSDVSTGVPSDLPALVPDTSSAASPPESYLYAVDKFVTEHKARPAPQELWQAPGYAEADDEQRQLLLNNFICDNLENADFLQLVQDTEKAWRRIGLGM